ncbi:MAG: puromycin-sensitive aminopeptidase [Candidatus Saccharibacteria bacterium]|nr:puromycin-sensitive aminopeptidase [Candidatus Saccharibacteria bacterium]
MPNKVTRLYTQFQPDNYQLHLKLDREAMKFSGTVTITGKKVGRPSQRLTFHAKGLNVSAATITKHDKQVETEVGVSRINLQKSFDEVRLHAGTMMYPGQYTVTLEFSGDITRPMNGIYPCFFEEDGTEKVLLATQFESHHAREAFPCIDEPEAKATFDLTLTTPADEPVIANTPIKSQDGNVTTFETTPRMSTYLLAFVCGELKYLESKTANGTVVRTYATPANVEHTRFALDVAVKCLEFYNEYFDIPYPLAKCDFIALPDFASGAMENWGCITFREQALFVDEANTSLPMKQYVANVVAHELTHQWFGNLVTMRWWNDLWLNESFASWMSYLAVDHLFPEWDVWTQFVVDEQAVALKLDALDNTHPIEVTINHPDEIRTIFDAISYEKGASVLQMLKNYLGDEPFRDGLRQYLKQHAYDNAETTDLWAALEDVSGKPISSFMSAWTGQPGYPLLRAHTTDTEVTVSQQRFYLNPASQPSNIHEQLWPVPLLASASLSTDRLDMESLSEPLPPTNGPVIFNHNRTGFYRVIYDKNYLHQIKDNLMTLDPLDRLGLLSDAFEAAKAGYSSTLDALRLLEAYKDEPNTFVWDVITGALGSVRTVMRDEELREAMKPLGRELAEAQVHRLGWNAKPEENHFDTLLRPTVLGLASSSDDKGVVKEAMARFESMTKPEDIAPDLRGIVYGTAAREGGEAEFDKMLKMHNDSRNSEERVTLSAALTGFKQPELIKRALDTVPTKDVRLQDAAYWVAYSFMNRHARDMTWDWMTSHWDWLEKNLGDDLAFYRMPNYAGRNYSDTAFLPTFTAFFEGHMSAAFERPVKQAIETIEWQAGWKDRDLSSVKKYFSPETGADQ